MHAIYWLHLNQHINIQKQGYVGVTNNFDLRKSKHLREIRLGIHPNKHLTSAIKKYGTKVKFDVVLCGSEQYCYDIEKILRPSREIGWNIAEGGFAPPNQKGRISPFKGMKHTKQEINRRRIMLIEKDPLTGRFKKKEKNVSSN